MQMVSFFPEFRFQKIRMMSHVGKVCYQPHKIVVGPFFNINFMSLGS